MISVVIAYFMNGEPILFMEIAGMVVCFIGIYIFADGKKNSENTSEQTNYFYGLVAVLISAFCTAFIAPMTRQL